MSDAPLQDTDLPTETPPAAPTLASDGGDSPSSVASDHAPDVTRDTSGSRWARDEAGRFAPKPKSEGEPAPGEGSATASGTQEPAAAEGTQDTDEAGDVAPEGLAALEQQQQGEEEEPEGQPWSFRSEGRDYTLGNSTFYPGIGLVVPEAHMDALHRLLGRVTKSDTILAQRDQLLETARQEIAAEKEFNAMAAQQWQSLAELVRNGNHEEAFKTLLEFAADLPKLQAEARATVLEQRLQQRERQDQPDPHVQQRQALEEVDEALGEAFAALTKEAWAKVLTQQDLQRTAAQFLRRRGEFVVQRPDGLYLDEAGARQAMQQELEYLAGIRREQAEAARRVQQAAEQNARRTKETIAAAPPAVTGTPAAAPPATGPKTQQFATADDYYNWTTS